MLSANRGSAHLLYCSRLRGSYAALKLFKANCGIRRRKCGQFPNRGIRCHPRKCCILGYGRAPSMSTRRSCHHRPISNRRGLLAEPVAKQVPATTVLCRDSNITNYKIYLWDRGPYYYLELPVSSRLLVFPGFSKIVVHDGDNSSCRHHDRWMATGDRPDAMSPHASNNSCST